jgi:hypothetical protein
MPTRDEERQQRLAAALRDNLRRRKAQARAQAETPPPSKAAGPGSPEDGG